MLFPELYNFNIFKIVKIMRFSLPLPLHLLPIVKDLLRGQIPSFINTRSPSILKLVKCDLMVILQGYSQLRSRYCCITNFKLGRPP